MCLQALDPKTLSRLESAVSKSPYAGQGKKLRVTNKVRNSPGDAAVRALT
jgi:hypothetical protein